MVDKKTETQKNRKIVVTRPDGVNEESCEKLQSLGYRTLSLPMQHIEVVPFKYPEEIDRKFDAIIFTSHQAVKYMAQGLKNPRVFRRIPIFAVGSRAIAVAEGLGFRSIKPIYRDAADLISDFQRNMPELKSILWFSGRHQAVNLVKELESTSRKVTHRICYEAKLLDHDLPEILIDKSYDFVFYSRRALEQFEKLAEDTHIKDHVADFRLFAMSPRIASSANLAWKNIHVAEQPNEESLIDLIQKNS